MPAQIQMHPPEVRNPPGGYQSIIVKYHSELKVRRWILCEVCPVDDADGIVIVHCQGVLPQPLESLHVARCLSVNEVVGGESNQRWVPCLPQLAIFFQHLAEAYLILTAYGCPKPLFPEL